MATKDDNRFLVWAIVASQFPPPFMFSGVAVALPAMGAAALSGLARAVSVLAGNRRR